MLVRLLDSTHENIVDEFEVGDDHEDAVGEGRVLLAYDGAYYQYDDVIDGDIILYVAVDILEVSAIKE